MAVTNASYITDLDELKLITNYRVFRELCSVDEDAGAPTDALAGDRLDRAYMALNYGKSQVDAMLSNVYSVPFTETPTNTYPDLVVKRWNVQFALYWLYQLHADRTSDLPEMLQDIHDDIRPYIEPDGLSLPSHGRGGQPGPAIYNPKPISESPFDRGGRGAYWGPDVFADQDGFS